MKIIPVLFILMASSLSHAHDDGHGPKLTDSGKYGGLVSAMVHKADAEKGANAALVHKAELVRAADGTTRIYLYDLVMKPLDLKLFDSSASASIGARVKGKWITTTFKLDRKENYFIGKMPKPSTKPYDLDIIVKREGSELLSAFDNLD